MIGKTVLVVDDCEELLELLARTFKEWGLTVLSATNGAQAVEIAFQGIPDLILMDLQMPVMNGYEVTRRIRCNGSSGLIPIIIFSSDCDGAMCEALRVAGCNECLQKPVDPVIIRNMLSRYLS